ncbi:MAG: M23 family metallopeptidase [Spirochaetales bacterium]|nr:M23 family metallopeptidase [Spirochaetales bacterium]
MHLFSGSENRGASQSVYVEPEEVKAFFIKREQNRLAAAVTIEESRVIASNWIKKERSKINSRFFFRRRSYELIAKSILSSKNYDELNYQLSRLPETEKQAYATLTIDRNNITTMDHYEPSIPGLIYPIELPGEQNTGEDLLITSFFSNRRVSPLGSGGVKPHLAVDIINIGNIDYVSRAGDLNRGENHPGYIVSVADGVVKSVEYNHIYGWNVTVEHDRNLIPYQKRRGVLSFETFYSHLDKDVLVKEGDVLGQGQKIAALGNSGLSTGPHLHFELRLNNEDGKTVNINPYPGSEW